VAGQYFIGAVYPNSRAARRAAKTERSQSRMMFAGFKWRWRFGTRPARHMRRANGLPALHERALQPTMASEQLKTRHANRRLRVLCIGRLPDQNQ